MNSSPCSIRLRLQGFSLIELMLVLAIIAILALVALPGYQEQLRKTRRSIVKAQLHSLLAKQEQFFVNNRRYAEGFAELGVGAAAGSFAVAADGSAVPLDADRRVYQINLLEPTATSYSLQAVPQLAQAADRACGSLQISSLGVTSASGVAGTSVCW